MFRNNLAKLMIDRGISATQLFNDTGIARLYHFKNFK